MINYFNKSIANDTQIKKFNNRHDGDGLLVSTSLLNNNNEHSLLSNLLKRHRNAITNRNHALISISHPHYSLYLQPPPSSYLNYLQQNDNLLLNSLINPLLLSELNLLTPSSSLINLPLSTTSLTMRNLLGQQIGQQKLSAQKLLSSSLLNNPSIYDSSLIYKNNDPLLLNNNNNNYQFNDNNSQQYYNQQQQQNQFTQNTDVNYYRPYNNNRNQNHQHHNHNYNYNPNSNRNKHKIQIGEKFSQSIYANSQNLRYENPKLNHKSIKNNQHEKNLPKRISSIIKNPYYGINDDDDGDNNNNDIQQQHQEIITNNLNESKRQDSKEEKGFF